MAGAAIFIILIIVPFITMPRDIKNGTVSPYYAVIKSVIITMAAVMVVMAVARASGHALYQTYQEYINDVSQGIASDENFKNMLGLGSASNAEALTTITAVYEMMAKRVPAYIVTMSLVLSYFVYTRLSRSAKKAGLPVQMMPKFKEFSLPPNCIMPMVIFYFIAVLMSRGEFPAGDFIYQNINYVFDLAFVLQGASVMFMMCDARKWPKAVAVLIVFIFWNMYMLRQALVILGMFDLIFGMKARVIMKAQLREQVKRERKNRRR